MSVEMSKLRDIKVVLHSFHKMNTELENIANIVGNIHSYFVSNQHFTV